LVIRSAATPGQSSLPNPARSAWSGAYRLHAVVDLAELAATAGQVGSMILTHSS